MARRPISVYQLNQYIKRSLETDPVLRDVAVHGEISRITFQKNGYVYFDLKDERSSISCAIWQDLPGKQELAQGKEVTVYGRISVYDVRGTYTLAVNAFELAGEGDLAIAFAKLKKKLAEEGLFDQAHKKPIPVFPSHVGVITASTGAAIRDIVRIITDRNEYVDIHLFPVSVQGPSAPMEIAAAIDRAGRHYPWLDVLIVGRGGGSEEDLAAFSQEIVARSIYTCPIPIISAVGHESDIAISDFVADVRAATPTDAANIAVPDTHLLRETLETYKQRMAFDLKRHLTAGQNRLDASGIDFMGQLLHERIRLREERINGLVEKLHALDPVHTLDRGYAMVKDENGSILTSIAEMKEGNSIQLTMKDGTADATVDALKRNKE
ncbi:MAG: exodeoxyribonuclease VII large subunit [Firmicutes bacterium]|nr:exodeoxyribonuclease VII large subunit [Bacillota bacterium]MBQ3964551.1 exodeoxyribonuclease VII large subunit [Bacillota bacterium]